LILVTCILIVFAGNLNSQPAPPPGKTELDDYIGDLKDLSTTGDESQVNMFFSTYDKFAVIVTKKLETYWKDDRVKDPKYAPIVGRHLAIIIKNNLDNPKILKLISKHLREIKKVFKDKDYQTASRYLYNSIVKILNDHSKFKADLNIINKAGKTNYSLTEIKTKGFEPLADLGHILDILQISNTKEVDGLNEILKDYVTAQKDARKEFEENYLKKDENFIVKHLELLISILFALFLFSILLGLFALFIKSKTKVNLPLMTVLEQKINKLKERDGGNSKDYNSAVNIEKGLELFVGKMIELVDLIGMNTLQKSEGETSPYGEKIEKLEDDFKKLGSETKAQIETRMATVGKELKLTILEDALKEIGDGFKKIQPVHPGAVQTALSSNQIEKEIVEAERNILIKTWDRIPSADEKNELIKRKAEIEQKEDFFRYCVQLESQINFNSKLSSYYSDIFRPLRNYKKKIIEILDTEQMVEVENKEDKKSVTSNRSNDIVEIKQKINFLVLLQNTNAVPGLLALKLENWIQMEFLKFADHFLRKYQQDEYQEKLSQERETVRTTVLGILSCFDIEPYPIVLGQTDFDSQIHKSESFISEPSMIDNVISDVVRNGFRKTDGKVIVVPEVIVNRR
jgi:hypothetical protein